MQKVQEAWYTIKRVGEDSGPVETEHKAVQAVMFLLSWRTIMGSRLNQAKSHLSLCMNYLETKINNSCNHCTWVSYQRILYALSDLPISM